MKLLGRLNGLVKQKTLWTRQASSSSVTQRWNVAVVGTGRMGQIRLAGMANDPRLQIAAIIDPVVTPDDQKQLENQYKTQCFSTIKEAAVALKQDNKRLDGVWVATPTRTHAQIIHECTTTDAVSNTLRAIGIEKPVGGTLEEIDAAYNACFDAKIHLVCSFQRRFDPSYQALWQACNERNRIGQVQSIHTVFRDHPCPPIEFLKTGGDPFHDLAVHDIDFVCHLLQEFPTRVYAYGTSLSEELRAVNVMDKASVWLEFPTSGVICTMDLSRSAAYGYDQRIEVSGDQGMLQVQNPLKTSVVSSTVDGITADTVVHSFPQRFRDAYLLELDHFVRVLEQQEHPQVTWNAARMATVISEAARLSAIHRKMVTIQYDKTKQLSSQHDPLLDCSYEY